jgi:exodeoxyribonuclease V gamma subunit
VLRIHASHRTEVLLNAFVRRLREERGQNGPFTPVEVVVPNGNVETYLRLGVAERLGIAANLETTFLRNLLARLAEQAVPDARVADATVVEGHLLALLHDDRLLERPDLRPVRDYLFAAGSERDALDRRRCQLGAALAHLFDEYASSRAEMLAEWRAGGRSAIGDLGPWQRALWLAIFGPGGRLERVGKDDGLRWLSLADVWDEAIRSSAGLFAGRTLHVFGLSYMATAYHRMLADLARTSEIHVYTLNPCREEEAELRQGDAALPAEDGLHLALALWARPGRENLRRLARVAGATLDQDFAGGTPATLLHRLQHDIVNRRAPAAAATSAVPDGSLRILPCPSLRRELEVVAAEIWRRLRGDPTLRACDVAVIVPEPQKDLYLAQLETVFHESCALPHNVADGAAAGNHRAAEAIALLIELPFQSFSRKDFLPLLTHPCLMARFPAATPEAWRALAADLGIVRGADRTDFDPAYLQRDLYSWEQGLARLALGAVADAAQADEARPFAFGEDAYLPGPLVDGDDPVALGFGLLARSLIADARFAAGRTGERLRPLPEWLAFLRSLVESYVVVPEDDLGGQAVVARFLAALAELLDSGLGATKVSYRVAAELAKRALADLPQSRGHYLASGVTVASFVPMRAIPFRAVFVLGLGQDGFPRPPGRHELDLREGHPQPGDVDGRAQDLYMFLETLLQARDHLTLSYVSRDEITGDELPASPALLELRAVLWRGYLGDADLRRLFADDCSERPPLRRYDDTDERRALLPAAAAEHQARALGAKLAGRLPDSGSARQRLAALPAELAGRLGAVLGLPGLVGEPVDRPATVIKIQLGTLRRFLEDPLQASARFVLGMRDEEDEDAADATDEPFDTGGLELASLLRKTMTSAILSAQGTPAWADLDQAHARLALAAELGAQVPTGLLREAGAAVEKQILRGWHAALAAVLGAGGAACRTFRFVPNLEAGEPAAAGAEVVLCPAPSFAVALPGREVTVTVVGETGLWAEGVAAHALRFTTRRRIAPQELGREDLGAFLEYVTLTAASALPARPGFASVLFHTDKGVPAERAWRFGRLTAACARDYLQRLCAALLGGGRDSDGSPTAVHPYLFPHEAVLASRREGTTVGQAIEALLGTEESARAGFSSTRGPVPDVPLHYAPPSDAEARRLVDERFGLFFRLAEEESA